MSTSALDILTLSHLDCGIIADGENLSASMAQQGLTRLNHMVNSWRTQYGTVTSIVRTPFNITSNQQTYFIGLGANFNVPRPTMIPGAALWLQALGSAVSIAIARTGYVATVTEASHGYAVGDESYVVGANEILYNGLQTVQSVPDANTWTFTVQGTPVTPATGTITAAPVTGEPTEVPCPVVTDDGYQFNQIKNLSNSQPTTVYYNPTFPFGQIVLWPRPSTAVNQLVLYLQNVFGGFANLTTEYDWPEIPGYAEALQYQLDLRLLIAYPQATPRQEIYAMADKSLGLIKRANNKLTDLPNEAALISSRLRGGYNINSGGYN